MHTFRLFPLLLLSVPVLALSQDDAPALRAALEYGRAHVHAETGLITDPNGVPDVPEASAGYVAACFATNQDLEQARAVLARIIACQIQTGKDAGDFPWQGTPGSAASSDATLYATPLLAWVLSRHGAEVGAELAGQLRGALELALRATGRVQVTPAQDTRYLLRSAAQATATAALGGDAGAAAGEVAQWLKLVTRTGLPAGHSPTFDAVRYVSLKWIHDVLPEARRAPVNQALALAALDLAGRVHPHGGYLAGAMTEGFPNSYASATGFARYVLHTDFGQPLPESVEPYVTAALLPQWRAPQSIADVTASSGLRRTRASAGSVESTDTYVSEFYSLGTMSGTVGAATVPIFCTFARSARPTMYFYCQPTPCTIQTVQADNLALCSFNFDGIGTERVKKAWVRGVLGTSETVKEVYCYGVPWNGEPTAVGELETVAVATPECYVGVTLTRTGPALGQQGSAATPGILSWSNPDGTGNLLLTIHGRQQDYAMPRPLYDVRAGVVIEVASQLAYPSLAEFAKHLSRGRLKQAAAKDRVRIDKPAPQDPSVVVPEPRSRQGAIYKNLLTQTTEYVLEGRKLELVEDLLNNQGLSRKVDDTVLDPTLLWQSEFFAFAANGDLTKALEPYAK